jgi:hypothetical protein
MDKGIGLSLAFDPSSAEALYPGRKRHVFHVPKGWPPTVNLSRTGGWIRALVPCAEGRSFRRVFDISRCDDNPVTDGKVLLWAEKGTKARDVAASVDGVELKPLGQRAHLEHQFVLEYEVPGALLSPGRHEFVVSGKQGSAPRLVFYPDALRHDFPASKGAPVEVPARDFVGDPMSQTVHY